MLLMPSQTTLYEEMSILSAQMVEAARANDWDRLIALEQAVAKLRAMLMNDDNNALTESELESKTRLIQRILEDDAEVRRHTEPWMERLRHFLGDAAKKRLRAQSNGL